MSAPDDFEAAYSAGITTADPEPPAPAPTIAPPDHRDGFAEAMPSEPFALEGTVLTRAKELKKGYVVLGQDTITAVTSKKPEATKIKATDGSVILPGLIDLHGHPEYNVFAAWEPPQLYANRHRWRDSDEYEQLVKGPYREMKKAKLVSSLTRYAEIRALVGGVTAIQGAGVSSQVLTESLVRNVDRRIFGQHRARSIIDLGGREDALEEVRADIEAGLVDRVFIHVAEGIDDRSRKEFDTLAADTRLFGPTTVLIHATALDRARWEQVAAAGASLVWSPQSNLRLYGQTTDVASPLKLGVPVGIGADWVPSGSNSTLAELRVARHQLTEQGVPDDPRRLVGMVTWGAADIAGLGDRIGDLKPGMAADVVVLERCHEDPWESVLRSDPSSVQMVMIGGNIVYARSDWYAELAESSPTETFHAWGRTMTLDTAYSVKSSASPPPNLATLRATILASYINAGPIFA